MVFQIAIAVKYLGILKIKLLTTFFLWKTKTASMHSYYRDHMTLSIIEEPFQFNHSFYANEMENFL